MSPSMTAGTTRWTCSSPCTSPRARTSARRSGTGGRASSSARGPGSSATTSGARRTATSRTPVGATSGTRGRKRCTWRGRGSPSPARPSRSGSPEESLNSRVLYDGPSDHAAETELDVPGDPGPGVHPQGVHGRDPRDPDQPVGHRGPEDEVSGEAPPPRGGAVPDPAHRPGGGADLREPVHLEEGGERVPPQAPFVPAQRPAREQNRDGGGGGPDLRGDARRVRRCGRRRRPGPPGHENHVDRDDRGPHRGREGGPPEGGREAPDAVADRDRDAEGEVRDPLPKNTGGFIILLHHLLPGR